MNKNKVVAIFSIVIISMVMSLIAVFVACYRTEDLGFDYQGVIVGVLSLLVTALLGWQIYSTIAMEERMRKISQGIVTIEADKLKLEFYRSLIETYRNLTLTSINAEKFLDTILYINCRLSCVDKCRDEIKAKDIILDMFLIIKKFKTQCEENKEYYKLLKTLLELSKQLLKVYPNIVNQYLELHSYFDKSLQHASESPSS